MKTETKSKIEGVMSYFPTIILVVIITAYAIGFLVEQQIKDRQVVQYCPMVQYCPNCGTKIINPRK